MMLPQKIKVSSTELWKAACSAPVRSESTAVEIYKMNSGQLSQLNKDGDRSECHKLIALAVLSLNQFYGQTWSDFQINMASSELYSKYFYWHILDLRQFVNYIITGRYVSNKNWSPAILMEFATKYDMDRSEKLIDHDLTEHDKTKYDPDRWYELYKADNEMTEEKKNKENEAKRLREIINKKSEFIERNFNSI